MAFFSRNAGAFGFRAKVSPQRPRRRERLTLGAFWRSSSETLGHSLFELTLRYVCQSRDQSLPSAPDARRHVYVRAKAVHPLFVKPETENGHSERALMEVRFYRDPETGLPHFYGHGVTENEVEGILTPPTEDSACADGSRQALGKTQGRRFLRVIYVPDEEHEGVFVVTAYPLTGRALKAFRRRQRRRKR